MSTIILDLEADRMLAVEATFAKDGVKVRRAFAASLAESLRGSDDTDAVGTWIREQLDAHGFKGKSVILAVSRGEVLVKRLEAPADSLSASERHGMIKLQMSRQASLTSASSVIDYVEVEPKGDRPGFILASAMPMDRVEARKEIASAAGLKLEGIRLRTAGVRALVGEEIDMDRSILMVNPGIGSVELLMLVGGVLVFSRSIAAPRPEVESDATGYADRIAVEASRTLVSFRLSAEGAAIEHAVILSGGTIGDALANSISERLEMPAETLDPAAMVAFEDGIDLVDQSAIASLSGLLLCRVRGIAVHDFANPTAPPDTTAGVRQAVMGGMFLLVLLAGVGFLLGQRTLASAKRDRSVAKQAHDDALGKYYESQLSGGRLGHLKAWSADDIDWPAHLEHIVNLLPDADSVALGQIAVRLDRAAAFEPGKQLNDADAWSTNGAVVVTVSGAARNRAFISQLRERLLDSGVYTVSSIGPEVEDRFGMQIATSIASPVVDQESKANGDAGEPLPGDSDESDSRGQG